MSKIENIFGDFSAMATATNDSIVPVYTTFDVFAAGLKIFDWFESFTLFWNNLWNLPSLDGIKNVFIKKGKNQIFKVLKGILVIFTNIQQ